MGVGAGQAAAIVLRVPIPPPSPSSSTPSRLPEPAAPADKGAATPHPAQRPPLCGHPFQLQPSQSPRLGPQRPHSSPSPARRGGAARTPLAQLDGEQHPGPRPAAAAGGEALRGGPGQSGGSGRGASTSWCGGTYCRRGRRASRNWKARSRESQT
jgi:hypothetical protein